MDQEIIKRLLDISHRSLRVNLLLLACIFGLLAGLVVQSVRISLLRDDLDCTQSLVLNLAHLTLPSSEDIEMPDAPCHFQ